ncbi:glycosyltransferase, partial [Nostoc sp. NIES-2111]
MSYQRDISLRTTSLAYRLSRGTLEFTAISEWMVLPVRDTGVWHLVPNAVPVDRFRFQPSVHDDAPLVFLGRVEPIKGPDVAIEIARLSGRRLVIAGNVPAGYEDFFNQRIRPHVDGDRVRYIGAVDDEQKNELLGGAAAFLMPISWEEPFGIVMIEAMACGTPVLGFRRGAVPEVVDDGSTGFVRDTAAELAQMVARLGEIDRSACRRHVEAQYSSDVIVDRYIDIYRAMVKRRGALRAA